MRTTLVLILSISLAGCSASGFSADPTAVPVVPMERVINSMKCGLANALVADHSQRSGLLYSKAVVKMQVNMTRGVDAKGNITAGIPISSGILTPSFSLTGSEVRTLNTAVDFDFDLSSFDIAVCNGRYAVNQDAGFSIWLSQVVSGISRATAGPPYASLKNYDFDSDFMVKSGGSVGADAKISIVKVSASVAAANSDVHHMKVTIAAVHRDGSGKVQQGGPRFFPSQRGPAHAPEARPFGVPTHTGE